MNKVTQEVTIDGNYKKVVTIMDDGSKEVRYAYDDSNDNTVNIINGEVINAYNGNHKALLVACILVAGMIIFGASWFF